MSEPDWKDWLTFEWWDTTDPFLHEGRTSHVLYLTDGFGLNLIQYGDTEWRMNVSMRLDEDFPLEASSLVEARARAIQELRGLCLAWYQQYPEAEHLKHLADHLLTYDEEQHGSLVDPSLRGRYGR